MSISELQNEIESWDESFASAINYLESVIVHAEVVDSSLKELVENYGKVEQEVNVRVRTLKDLMLKDLNYEELENFFEKRCGFIFQILYFSCYFPFFKRLLTVIIKLFLICK